MEVGGRVEFWKAGNFWRFLFYPILYVAVAILWRNLFFSPTETPLHVLSALGGGQCLLLVGISGGTELEIFCAAMLLITIIEIVHPSKVHEQTPKYTERQRIGWGIFHAWAWTSFGLGIEHALVAFTCGR